MVITGGHFTLDAEGKSINPGTIGSFHRAVELYALAKEEALNPTLGILINDIGAVCTASACSTTAVISKVNFVFPETYRAVLDEFGITQEELTIFWEKHIRNRAKKLLHKRIAAADPNLFYREGEYHYKNPQLNTDIILTRKIEKDKRGTPACPLIMSAYALEHNKMGFSSSFNFYYVGEDNYKNVANHFVIEKGAFLAKCFDLNTHVKNVYIFNDKIMKNF